MPRAFLITHRRYNTPVDYERREISPERRVSVAELDDDLCRGQLPPPSEGPTDTTDNSDDASSECPEELYNLTQLADVSLAAAAGHLFGHHRTFDATAHIRKYPFLGSHLYHYERLHKSYSKDYEETRTSYKDEDNRRLTMGEKYFGVRQSEGHHDQFEDQDGELQDGALSSGEVHGCPDCGKRYSTSSNLARHRQTHRSLGDKKARRCPHCDKVYVSMPAFSMHVRTHNQGCKCTHCGKCFSRPWLLQGHIRTHTGEKPFKCSICTKAFADKSNLRAHVQTHSNTKPHVCSRCGKAFALKSYLYKHEESSCMRGAVHGAGETPPRPAPSPSPTTVPTSPSPPFRQASVIQARAIVV